jgi:uracil-DNA glycosylase family 4
MTGQPNHTELPASQGIAAWADWYLRMGVLDCVDEVPRDRLSPPAIPVPLLSGPASAEPLPSSRAAATSARMEPLSVASARALAQSCRSLDELERALTTFEGCPLAETATRLCFADGNRAASLMLVGEAPGAEEDRQGKPFVGPSGQLLDRMLAAVGLARSDTYITNLIYWRPPGNRSPTSSELATCLPFLERQIELLRPRLLVSVGGVAARVLLDLKDGVGKLRGRKFVYRPADGGEPVPTFVIFHPAYLLRQPLHKRLAWRDMLQLRAELRAQGGWPLEGAGNTARTGRRGG